MKRLIYLLALVLLASCHSSKKAQKDDSAVVTSPNTTVTTPSANTGTPSKKLSAADKLLFNVDSVSYANYIAKVKVNLKQGSKSISTNGSLKMRWDDVIQISLVDPLIGITEVGRLEFSKDDVLIVDRINKQYIRESYETLSALAKTELSYKYVQALFWSEAQKKNNNSIDYKIPLKSPVTLHLEVGNVTHKDSWETHYQVSSKYNKVTIEELFKTLSSL